MSMELTLAARSHFSTAVSSLQRPALHSGQLSTAASPLQRPSLYSGHLSTATSPLQRPALSNGNKRLVPNDINSIFYLINKFSITLLSAADTFLLS